VSADAGFFWPSSRPAIVAMKAFDTAHVLELAIGGLAHAVRIAPPI